VLAGVVLLSIAQWTGLKRDVREFWHGFHDGMADAAK
jgi:hypothetical protein